MNQNLMALWAEMQAVKAEIKGMEAENQFRIQVGNSIAYGDEAFQEKANYLYSLSDLIRNTGE